MESRTEKSHHLFDVAETQQGYFTSADAKRLGYDYPHQHFHVNQGNWIRVDRGIYRLKKFPAAKYEDLMRWWLWSRKKGVLSHETAAALYDLGDLLPSKIHLTVPGNFRKRPVKNIVLHKSNLRESEIEKRDDLPVTAPLRTILDLARSHLDDERLTAVTKDAIQKGLVSRRELLNVLAAIPKDIDPATQATLQTAATVNWDTGYVDNAAAHDLPQVRENTVRLIQSQLAIRDILREIKHGLEVIYGEQLRGVYLFGSYSRGDADEESDLDILVVLQDFARYALEVDRTAELAADLSLKYSVTVSLVFFREHDWLRGDTSFLSNVRDEVVPA
jgi:predicted transcriptional regulator of viral defense system